MKHEVYFSRRSPRNFDDDIVSSESLTRIIALAQSLTGYPQSEAEEQEQQRAENLWVQRYAGNVEEMLSLVHEIIRLRTLLDGEPLTEHVATVEALKAEDSVDRVDASGGGFKTVFYAKRGVWRIGDLVRIRRQAEPAE